MCLDITNQKFNKYTAIKYLGNSMWECKCDCGNIRKVNSWNLRDNVCKSCGCLVKEKKKQKNKKRKFHNLSKSRIYRIHKGMISRCKYSSSNRYERYVGRGITICDEWLGENGFINFYNWAMENGYQDNLTIERINIDKNYCPENCKWIPKEQQSLNTSRNHYVTYKGITKCVEHWCKELGLKSNTIYSRVKKIILVFMRHYLNIKNIVKMIRNFVKMVINTLQKTHYILLKVIDIAKYVLKKVEKNIKTNSKGIKGVDGI